MTRGTGDFACAADTELAGSTDFAAGTAVIAIRLKVVTNTRAACLSCGALACAADAVHSASAFFTATTTVVIVRFDVDTDSTTDTLA